MTSKNNFIEHQKANEKRYEIILIPLSAAVGVLLTFSLYMPGGASAHLFGAALTYVLTLISWYMAIRAENKKSFIQPLEQLNAILNDINFRKIEVSFLSIISLEYSHFVAIDP